MAPAAARRRGHGVSWGRAIERSIRQRQPSANDLLAVLLRLLEPRPVLVVVGRIGPVHAADHPEQELAFMVRGKPGQRVALSAKAYRADGITAAEFDGAAIFRVDRPELAELRADAETGQQYAYLLQPGTVQVTLEVDADLGPGVRLISDVGEIVIADPAAEAAMVALELGAPEDVPA